MRNERSTMSNPDSALYERRTPNYGDMAVKKLKLLRDEETLCDIVLISEMDGRRVPCHRILLAMASPFFRAMFTSPMLESQQKEITLGVVAAEQLLALVNFCYTGAIHLRNNTEVRKLLRAAAYLQIDAAVSACKDFLIENLHPANCLGTFALADEMYMNNLKIRAERYIDKHFAKVHLEEEFMKLPLNRLVELIDRDELCVESEEVVFESIISWVKYDVSSRIQHFEQLLNHTRLHSLPSGYLKEKVEPICADYGFPELLLRTPDVIKYRKLQKSSVIAIYRFKDQFYIDRCCPIEKTWSSFGKVRPRRELYASVILNDMLLIMGGRSNGIVINKVNGYNLRTNSIVRLAPMLAPHYNFYATVLDGFIYVVDGVDHSVERYDPAENTWSKVRPFEVGRVAFQVGALDGRLYVCGGRNGQQANATNECYDPKTNEWTTRKRMNHSRYRHGVAVNGGYMYVVGGHNGKHHVKSVERYDPRIDKWSRLCNMEYPRRTLKCPTFGNRLLAMRPTSEDYNLVDEYDFETNEWREMKSFQQRPYSLKYILTLETKSND